MPEMYMVRSKKSGKFLRKSSYSGYHLSHTEGGTMFTKLSHIKLARFGPGFPKSDLEIIKFKIVPDTVIQMTEIV